MRWFSVYASTSLWKDMHEHTKFYAHTHWELVASWVGENTISHSLLGLFTGELIKSSSPCGTFIKWDIFCCFSALSASHWPANSLYVTSGAGDRAMLATWWAVSETCYHISIYLFRKSCWVREDSSKNQSTLKPFAAVNVKLSRYIKDNKKAFKYRFKKLIDTQEIGDLKGKFCNTFGLNMQWLCVTIIV